MSPYVIDTNCYIRAFSDGAYAVRLRAFHRDHLPALRMSAVVLFELLVGALDEGREGRLERAFLEPFRSRGLLLIPGIATWQMVAKTDRALRRAGGFAGSLDKRAFLADMLIAASCREVGATLITENARDFSVIRKVLAFRFVTKIPGD